MPEFQTHVITTRQEARSLGFVYYFTGRPCKHGHSSLRFVKCATCHECKKIEAKSERFIKRQKEYREKEENKRIKKDQMLQSQYGITLAEFEAMIAAQDHKCPICEVRLFRGKGNQAAVVDHCHPTGRVRGIICNRCNRGLGFFRDHIVVLRRALAYLTRDSS